CSCPISVASSSPVASRACSTPSGELATSFVRDTWHGPRRVAARISTAFDRVPIRGRLALVSALLTFVILCAFALVVGSLTVHRIRADFNREVAAAASDLAGLLQVEVTGSGAEGFGIRVRTNLNRFAVSEHAVVRILTPAGSPLKTTGGAPNLGLANEAYVRG